MNIVITDGYGVNPGDLSWEAFRQLGDLAVYDRTPQEQIVPRLRDADVALINKTPITAQVLDACPRLKLICVMATGYNVVDCDAAQKRGIPVCNVPDYGTAAVAQYTFALLLELCHRVGHHDGRVHQGAWCDCPNFCFWDTPQMELAGKTLGIVGYGRIGKAVAKLARAFGMKVLVYSRRRPAEEDVPFAPLETVLKTADVLSLHCPQTEATTRIINRENLSKMKDGAILINTARGGLLDEQAVADALRSGKLRCAAVDVVSREPMERDNPLLTAPNCIITPHMAWAPVESRQRILDCTEQNIRAFLSGSPVHTVNQ